MRLVIFFVGICTLIAGQAMGAEQAGEGSVDLMSTPFEQLLGMEVITASKMAHQVSDASSAVSIVTAEDIRDYGYHSLADILNSMRGLYTTYDRAYQYLGGRGFGRVGDYTGRIMVMIDGYATNDNIYNQAYIDNSGLLDTALIERVEYVPGTGSVLYGNNAYFGIINIITKKGRDIGGAQLAGDVTSYGGKKGRATYGKQFNNGADILVSTSWLNSEGQNFYFSEFDTPATNNGVAHHLDYESSKRTFAKLSYEGWSVEGAYVDRKKGIPTASYDVEFNAYNLYQDTNAFLSAKYDAEINPQLKSSTHVYYGNYLDSGAGFYTGSGLWRENDRGQWWGVDQKMVATWFESHKLIFGAEYRDDFEMSIRNPEISTNNSRKTVSLYLQDEIRLNEKINLNLGGRYDRADDVGGNFSPRAALQFSVTPQTKVKASYSTAFRMPAAYEKYYTDGTQLPNLQLSPEYVTATELVLQHKFSPVMQFTASVYNYRTSDLITDVDLGPSNHGFVNAGSGHTQGVELELQRTWDNGTRLRTSYSRQNAIDQNDLRMINSPRDLAKINVSFPLLQHALRTGFELQYTGARLSETRAELGSYTLANLTFTSNKIMRGLSASASVRNLFDHRYAAVTPGYFVQDSLQMDGRNYWLQLQYDFK